MYIVLESIGAQIPDSPTVPTEEVEMTAVPRCDCPRLAGGCRTAVAARVECRLSCREAEVTPGGIGLQIER